jgi:YD repeat-containing protein
VSFSDEVVIDFADNHTGTGTVEEVDGEHHVKGAHVNDCFGDYDVTITLTPGQGIPVTLTRTVTARDAELTAEGTRGTRTTYDLAGNVREMKAGLTTDPTTALSKPQVTASAYDEMQRVTDVSEAVGTEAERRTHTEYDEVGNVKFVTRGLADNGPAGYAHPSTTAYAYDALNRQVATIDPLGNRTTKVYDARDNVVATVVAEGFRAVATFDAHNQKRGQEVADGGKALSVYDRDGQVIWQKDAAGLIR